MPEGFTPEWGKALNEKIRTDEDFREKVAKFKKTVMARVAPSPEKGVTEPIVFGFDFENCEYYFGEGHAFYDTVDYIFEGAYEDWYNVNEDIKGLVPSMMDQSVEVTQGSVSYVARFLPAIEKYFAMSRSVTDSYAGDFKPVAAR